MYDLCTYEMKAPDHLISTGIKMHTFGRNNLFNERLDHPHGRSIQAKPSDETVTAPFDAVKLLFSW